LNFAQGYPRGLMPLGAPQKRAHSNSDSPTIKLSEFSKSLCLPSLRPAGAAAPDSVSLLPLSNKCVG
jgi:hypothetical protein